MPFDGATFHKLTLAQELVVARLRYTRNQIAAGKWCQRHTEDSQGNRCLVGWLVFTPGCQIGMAAISHAWAALPESTRSHGGYCAASELALYNDTHQRQTIVRLLDRAIVAMETIST